MGNWKDRNFFSRSTVIRHLTGEKSSVNEKQTKLRQKNQTLIDFLARHRFSVLIPVNANKSKFEKMKKLENLGCFPRSATFNVFSQRDWRFCTIYGSSPIMIQFLAIDLKRGFFFFNKDLYRKQKIKTANRTKKIKTEDDLPNHGYMW